jgi:predicted nucleic acid-binding protein
MNADAFIDTNVLLYTIDEDPASGSKRQRAQHLLLSERWAWSVQVAAEFFVNATSAKRPFRLAPTDAAALVEAWFAFPTVELTPALFRTAVNVRERFQLSYWHEIHAPTADACPPVSRRAAPAPSHRKASRGSRRAARLATETE